MLDGIALRILRTVLSSASPQLRQAVKELVLQLEEQAKQTENQFDDLLVDVLKSILDIDNG